MGATSWPASDSLREAFATLQQNRRFGEEGASAFLAKYESFEIMVAELWLRNYGYNCLPTISFN